MRTDEEPRFRRVGRPRTITGAEAFAKDAHLRRAEERRLRSEGFISITYRPTTALGLPGSRTSTCSRPRKAPSANPI
jgi:hypothetical protein